MDLIRSGDVSTLTLEQARRVEELGRVAFKAIGELLEVLAGTGIALRFPKVAEKRPAPARRMGSLSSTGGRGTKENGERRVMVAIAQHPGGVTREQLTVLVGYKKSTRDTYLQRLKADGLVVQDGAAVVATMLGIQSLGPSFEKLPTGDALLDHWIRVLGDGGEGRILGLVAGHHPEVVTREALSAATGYAKPSRDTYIHRLAARKLVITSRDGVQASPLLFG